MRIEEVVQQPGNKERLLKNDILKTIHVAIPGEIEAYYPETRTAVIQPVIREWNCKDNPPLLLDVPVFFWGNFTFTPQKGDGCLVVCADSCIDAWFQNGGVSSPVVARTHSLSDGFAFVGFRQTGGIDLETEIRKIAGKKDKQEPVSDPAASGTGVAFVDSISQNEQGVITVHKMTVRTVEKNKAGLCPALPNETATSKYLRQDGQWAEPPGTEYSVVTKQSDGLCPALPNETATNKYFRQDGQWAEPPDTKYGVVDKGADGLCPALPNETATDKYLRQDGQWEVPPDTIVEIANNLTQSSAGKALDAYQGKVLKGLVDGIGKTTTHSGTSTTNIKRTWELPGGLLITSIHKEVTVDITNTSGSIYYGTISAETWPVAYSARPIVLAFVNGSETNCWVWGNARQSTTSTGTFFVARGTSASQKKVWINILGIGYVS